MNATFDRRHLLRLVLGLAGLASGAALAAGADAREADTSPREIYVWRFTGETRCNAGFSEEHWGYYECIGTTCTPLHYEWRQTTRPC